MDFRKYTEELWRAYISIDDTDGADFLECFDEDCVIIGTGAHEFYKGVEGFADDFEKSVTEREEIQFQFKEFWCEQQEISPECVLVYGNVYVWGENKEKTVYIDMQSRFSMLYQLKNGKWKVVHVHQSMPYFEQLPGEYYPKTLTEQVKQVQTLAKKMEKLAQRDSLTGLYNYRTFESRWNDWEEDGWLFVLDVDDFKDINNSYGHIAGNHVLKKLAEILQNSVRTQDIVCRMGGDEFIMLCGGLKSQTEANKLARRIVANIAAGNNGEGGWPAISMGGTAIYGGEALEEAINRADKALYEVKNTSKNGYKLVFH